MNAMSGSPRTWEVMCHLSALAMFLSIPFGNILGPLVVWLIKRGDSPSVDEHGKEALNFQISITLYVLLAVGGTLLLSFVMVGLLFWPLTVLFLIAAPFLDLILVIVAAVKASNGDFYRYPLTIPFLQ